MNPGGGYEPTLASVASAGGDLPAGAKQHLFEHLDELRLRFFFCVAAVVPGAILAFVEIDPLLRLLLSPLPAKTNALLSPNGTPMIAVTRVGEGFTVMLKLAIASGVAVAAPVWIYQLWRFVSPALRPRELRHALPFTLVGVGLFVTGIVVGFITLRYPINWLLGIGEGRFAELITADSYLSFVAFFLLAFGMVFELPLVVTFMASAGIVSATQMRENRAKILVGLWIAACFITPGADPYSPLIVGLALTVLLFVSEGLIRWMD